MFADSLMDPHLYLQSTPQLKETAVNENIIIDNDKSVEAKKEANKEFSGPSNTDL
jgi:hypothetical protein